MIPKPTPRTWMISIIDPDSLGDPDLAVEVLDSLVRFLDQEPEDVRQRLSAFLDEEASREAIGDRVIDSLMTTLG